jgi:hypothetical protein
MDWKLDTGGLARLGNHVVNCPHSHRPGTQGSEYVSNDGKLHRQGKRQIRGDGTRTLRRRGRALEWIDHIG